MSTSLSRVAPFLAALTVLVFSIPGFAATANLLTETEAALRSKQIGAVSYNMWFGLTEGETFDGRAKIGFDLLEAKNSPWVRLDFEGGKVSALKINGQTVDAANHFDGHRILIPMTGLKPHGNSVEVAFTHAYSDEGTGLHHFKDPVDSQTYVYTNFEPYDAHRMFPCFDQPDLKASFEIQAETPKSWVVISNTREKSVKDLATKKLWSFPESARISTYVFALHAGPYSSWSKKGPTPMRLFARKSLAQYVDSAEWLDITARGLAWYGKTFGYPYPFKKYDQIIVPDFNAGAMENVGAVTFAEKFIYRSKETVDRHRSRANVILHEMAHMWFGDLVTMKWWNGLWLNESFATFMASWAVDQATTFKGSWQDFFVDEKQWAYWEDQLVTTHPIEGVIPDTLSAESSFDGITYGKGAAVLKQLSFWLGEKDFRKGLQSYFQKHAFQNTTIGDFMGSLAEASGKDLAAWQKSWLQSQGLNTISTDWSCTQGKIDHFSILQAGSDSNSELRSHRTRVALFSSGGDKAGSDELTATARAEISFNGAKTEVPELVSKPCPTYVFSNEGDFDYAKASLDPISVRTLRERLGKVKAPFDRQMAWAALWEMTRDAQIAPQDFIDIAITQGSGETDNQILESLLENVERIDHTGSAYQLLTPSLRAAYQPKIEQFMKASLLAAPAESDRQLIEFKALMSAALSPATLEWAAGLLDGKTKLDGFKIDQDRRWIVIHALARHGFPGVKDLLATELKADPTDTGSKAAISAEASVPDAALKKLWLARVTKAPTGTDSKAKAATDTYKMAQLREAMRGYNVIGEEKWTELSVDAFFEAVPRLAKVEEEEFLSRFTHGMFPPLCDARVVSLTSDLLKKHPEMPAAVIKNLKVGRQETERCIRARALSLASVKK